MHSFFAFSWNGKEDCIPLESYVPEWINLGAKIIGGCCRTYARDITRIKETVENFYGKNNINDDDLTSVI